MQPVSLDEPGWWYGPHEGLAARALAPASAVWGWFAERRFARTTAYRARLPVICVGNFTAGGTGKTPLSLAIAQELRHLGRSPAFLTRGYGGSIGGPHLVGPHDRARDVGDEPLLLAAAAPVMVSRDRAAGARAIEGLAPAPDVIVMDDGLQNPALAKDLTIAVVDGRRGLGNGRVMPAGPLRAPLAAQLARVDAVVINGPVSSGDAGGDIADRFRARFTGPVLSATVAPSGGIGWLRERPLVAYAAIGAPGRFFALLRALGGTVTEERTFPDHHAFRPGEAAHLLKLAAERGAQLVTTQKDYVRLAGGDGELARLAQASMVLPIEMRFETRDHARLRALIETALMRPRVRPQRTG